MTVVPADMFEVWTKKWRVAINATKNTVVLF